MSAVYGCRCVRIGMRNYVSLRKVGEAQCRLMVMRLPLACEVMHLIEGMKMGVKTRRMK